MVLRAGVAAGLRRAICAGRISCRKPATIARASPRDPDDPINILFSSGTTGEPKAIPWTQTTPIKCAADAHFHQDVRPGDVLVWPTNIGWMMGPWLIFASLLNRAAMGSCTARRPAAGSAGSCRSAGATMLGVVPSLVKTWRNTGCMDGCDWSAARASSARPASAPTPTTCAG